MDGLEYGNQIYYGVSPKFGQVEGVIYGTGKSFRETWV